MKVSFLASSDKKRATLKWGGRALLSDSRGFSMIEILVTISIVSLLCSLAVPNMIKMSREASRGNAQDQVAFDINRARNEAMSTGARVLFILTNNGSQYSLGSDYLPYSDTQIPDSTISSAKLPSGVTIISSRVISFDSRGFLVDNFGNPVTATIDFNCDGVKFGHASISPTGYYQYADGS